MARALSPPPTVNDRPKGATHVRLNGATLRWQKWGSRRVPSLAFFTPFRNSIFYLFLLLDFWLTVLDFIQRKLLPYSTTL